MPDLSPYMLFIKIVGVVLLAAALMFAWHKLTDHYIEIGVDRQYKEDEAANAKQRKESFAMYVAMSEKYKQENERAVALEKQLGAEHEKNAQLDDRNHIALAALQLQWGTNKDARCGQRGSGTGAGDSAATSDAGTAECIATAGLDEFLAGILQEVSTLLYQGDQLITDYKLQRNERNAVTCY